MRIFIASSGERLNMAIEVGSWLEGMNVEPVLWNEPEVFPLGVYTWDALIDLSKNVDAAVALLKYMTNEDSTSLLLYDYGRIPSTNIEIDDSKLTPLCADFVNLLSTVNAQTPWFDRVDTDLGNEFNNTTIGIANGDDVQDSFDSLQSYAESKSK